MKFSKTNFPILVLLFAAPSLFATPSYTITNLGFLSGQSYSIASAINNNGQVVGQSGDRAVSWDATTHTASQVPGTVAGAVAIGINDSGKIVGNSTSTASFFYNLVTTVAVGPAGNQVTGINNIGQIVGTSNLGAWISLNGAAPTILADFGFSSTSTEARAINSSGAIAGGAYVSATSKEPTYWDAAGVPHALGLLAAGSASAQGLNNSGDVVGISPASSSSFVPYVVPLGGSMTSLGNLGGSLGLAYGINDAGEIVGYSTLSGFSNFRAFLYKSGTMYNLNNIVTNPAGWTLEEARAINQQGQIVGYGTFNGSQMAFLLTPNNTPEPATLLSAGLALLLIGIKRRK